MKRTKTYDAVVKAGSAGGKNGSFEAILSAPTLDRDGDVFATSEWKLPLPDHITIDIDHGMSAATTVGSAEPFFDDDGNLRVRGTFASTPLGQEIRTLVNEGHIRTMSVAALEDSAPTKDADGNSVVTRELLNGAFVAVPSNREAQILASKSLGRPEMIVGHRAKSLRGSLGDIESTIRQATRDAFGSDDPDADWDNIWVQAVFLDELTGGRVVFEHDAPDGCQTLCATFELGEDGSVSFGEPQPARLVTTVEIDGEAPAATDDETDDEPDPADPAEADEDPAGEPAEGDELETEAADKPKPDDEDKPSDDKEPTAAAADDKPAVDDKPTDDEDDDKKKVEDDLKAEILADFTARLDDIFASRSAGASDESPDDEEDKPDGPARSAAPSAVSTKESAEDIALMNKARAMRLGLNL